MKNKRQLFYLSGVFDNILNLTGDFIPAAPHISSPITRVNLNFDSSSIIKTLFKIQDF